jgi:lactate dehydrogenase-like 2-hydroxyacid dehydrogenase
MADAITPIGEDIMQALPNLKMIHTEGVAVNQIDCDAARKRGIYVCNNKGANAEGVAEQAILLMLGVLRDICPGDQDVRAGHQIQRKERMMVEGIVELSACRVGLLGFGDIAMATAKLLNAFGAEVVYYNRTRRDEATEREYNVQYTPLETLAATCDIISLHLAVTPETASFVNAPFLEMVKPGAILINTARGDLVDQEALCDAILSGKIGGAGLDTLTPEPVLPNNPLLNLPEPYNRNVLFSPHIGGTTDRAFQKMHQGVWDNVARLLKAERPVNIVNGV